MKCDLRTRAGREDEIRERVRKYGGFSVFWITEHPSRATAAEHMKKRGELKAKTSRYPWTTARLTKQKQ